MTVFENEGQRQASAKVTSVGVKHVHTKARRYDRDLSVGVVLHIEGRDIWLINFL